MTRYDADGRDPGLAAERTDLSWNRSGLSLLACGALIMRGTERAPLTSANVAVGICVLLLGAFTAFLGAWHTRAVRRRHGHRSTTADLAPIAVGVALVGTAAFVLAAFG